MTQETETLEANSWITDLCPGCGPYDKPGYMHGAHCLCGGSNKRHAWAWERCQWEDHESCKGLYPDVDHDWIACDGSGWVLVVSTDALLSAGRAEGWEVEVGTASADMWSACIWLKGGWPRPSPDVYEEGTTPVESLLKAFTAALDALRQVKE